MVKRYNEIQPVEMWQGVHRKTLNYGERTLMVEITFEKDSVVKLHSHPHEQIGYLVSGNFSLTIGDETWEVFPGDSWVIPSNIPHEVLVLEESVAVEVFSPVREEYI